MIFAINNHRNIKTHLYFYEIPKDAVCLNSFDCVFGHKEVRCASKTEIKNGLQYANKKPSLPGDMIIYTPEDLVMN